MDDQKLEKANQLNENITKLKSNIRQLNTLIETVITAEQNKPANREPLIEITTMYAAQQDKSFRFKLLNYSDVVLGSLNELLHRLEEQLEDTTKEFKKL